MYLNDLVYLAATNATRNEPIMSNFSHFFPKLNKYKGNMKIVFTNSNTWLEISGLSSTKSIIATLRNRTDEGGRRLEVARGLGRARESCRSRPNCKQTLRNTCRNEAACS